MSRSRLKFKIMGWLVLVPLWCGAGASPAAALGPPLPADLDLERPSKSDGAVIVKLHLDGGEEVPLLVDTGSADTTLSESFAPRLGPRIATRRAPLAFDRQAGTQGIYRAPTLYAGDTELLMGPRVTTMKWLPAARGPGKGILGMDCLRHYCIHLDFVAGKMRFLDPDRQNTNDLGEVFPIGSVNQTFFDADLFGQGKMRFMLDTGMTGAFDAMLAPKVFRWLQRQYPTIGPDLIMTVPDGRAASGNIFAQLSLGGRTYTDLRFSEVDLHPVRVKGIIGMRFLARHKVTLNFPKRVLYLKLMSSAPLGEGPSAGSGASYSLPLHWTGSSRFSLLSMGAPPAAAPGQ